MSKFLSIGLSLFMTVTFVCAQSASPLKNPGADQRKVAAATPVPEPSTQALVILTLLGGLLLRHRRRH